MWLLWPFVAQGAAFPLGPDAPVYLWWTRIAGAEGLSAVGGRAGAPALALVLQGTLGVSVVAAVAALEISLGVAVGLASAALLRGRTTTAGWVLAGALAGTFAVHLAAGYLANLLEITAFLAAAVALAGGTRRGAWVAAGALAAGGLAHPLFFLLSAVVLLLTAASAWRRHRDEATRVAAAVAGGGSVVGIGLVALLAGPAPLDVDTSRDAFLRRAGLTAELRASYLDRFVHRWTRYVQWVSVPLAVVGIGEADGFVGRFLRAWGVALVAGVAIGLLTGWFPADRVVTFGFVVPILAALGVVRVSRWLGRRRALALAVAAGAVLAMLAGSFIAWNRQEPFLSVDEVRAVTIAGEAVAEVELATPLAFLVNDPDRTVSFLATRAGNVIRAGVPADRIRDVVVVVPAAGDGPASAERRALEELTASDLRRAETVSGTPAVRFVLVPFDPVDRPADAVAIDPSSPVKDLLGQTDPLEPSSAGAIGVSSVLALALLAAVGYGWARIAVPDAVAAAAVAPALGAAALVLVAIALERLGLAIGTTPGAWVVSAAAGGGGYVAWRVLERFAPVRPTPQVDQ